MIACFSAAIVRSTSTASSALLPNAKTRELPAGDAAAAAIWRLRYFLTRPTASSCQPSGSSHASTSTLPAPTRRFWQQFSSWHVDAAAASSAASPAPAAPNCANVLRMGR